MSTPAATEIEGSFIMSAKAMDSQSSRMTISSFRRQQKRFSYNCYALLVVILFTGLPLRVYWMIAQTPVLNADGSEYVRMAENLANGKGLVGNFDGPETMYTPLFPLLTAGVCLIVRNAELAARLVSLAFGVGLILPVFLIARIMYGKTVAHIGALFVALHPLFIKLSGSVFNENVYLFFLMMSLYWGIKCLEFQRIKEYVLLSLFLGLAYLTRPEAFAYPAFFVGAIWIVAALTGRRGWRPAIGSVLIIGVFLIVALPYVWFLYRETGHVRLEGKWNINYTIANRIRSGMDYIQAAYGLGPDESHSGPLLDPFHFAAYTPYSESLKDKDHTLLAMAADNWRAIYNMLWSSPIGSPFFLGLVLVGLFRKAWSLRRILHESVLMVMALSILFLMLTASIADFRYILPLVAISSVWVGNGAAELASWTRGLRASIQARWVPEARIASIAVPGAVMVLMFAVAWYGTRGIYFFTTEQASYADLKKLGSWVRAHSDGPVHIACNSTVLTYYAKATIIELPYASPAEALNYLSVKKPDFIVLDERDASTFPEVKDWLEHGILDSRAELLYDSGTKSSDHRIEVYRWHPSG
jgi:4-amino-4-deoxy-L-arabinose transferase-like glycosyltransferase